MIGMIGIVALLTVLGLSREEAKDAIRRQGGKAASSVSGRTDYLVVGSDPGSAKRQQAEEHGTEVIGEQQFLELVGRG